MQIALLGGKLHISLAIYVFISKIISYITAGIVLIVVARILGPTIYAVYSVAISAFCFSLPLFA